MPTTITGSCATTGVCRTPDTTPPPTPQIERAMAFARGSPQATFVTGSVRGASRGPDPAYLELSNVEGGTRFQLVNLSKKPDATFDDSAITLEPTGRDVASRRASVYLTDAQMQELDLKAGDIFLLRAIDGAGNVSGYVRGELEPDGWANRDVRDVVNGRSEVVRGTGLDALDGEAVRKQLIAKVVNDGRPPVMLENRITFAPGADGAATLQGNHSMEPNATLEVHNLRTGAVFRGKVADDATLAIPLKDMAAGDPILLRPTDHEGVKGQELRLTYSPNCAGGKAPVVSPLAARLGGVI